MIRFILTRFVGMIVVIFIVSVVTFLIFQIGPIFADASPVYYYIGKAPATPALVKILEHRYGFDQPIPVQYLNFVTGIFGKTITDGVSAPVYCPFPCFGYSFRQNELVSTLIARAIPVTASLTIGAAIQIALGLEQDISREKADGAVDLAAIGPADAVRSQLQHYLDAGATDLVLSPLRSNTADPQCLWEIAASI